MKIFYFTFLALLFFSCQNESKKQTSSPATAESRKADHKAFHSTLKKHINAVSTRDINTLSTLMHPSGTMHMMRPNTPVVYSTDRYIKYHTSWFEDKSWSLTAQITDSNVGDKLGWALTDVTYRNEKPGTNFYTNKMSITYVMEKVDGAWYVISDHSTSIKKTAQDAGYPQIDCKKSCCKEVWSNRVKRKMVSCIGIRDYESSKMWLFDATPDIKDQLHLLNVNGEFSLEGIFLTHAHMGHYTGLMHLGREAKGADAVDVYAMPRMSAYLQDNGPWSQLVQLQNILISSIQNKKEIKLSEDLVVVPIEVPHRDEFSETVGYLIKSTSKKILFIPDIDKWNKWDENISDYIKEVDLALLDGTFFQNGEIWGRDMSQIPHPFIVESIEQFKNLDASEKSKIQFIHLNHTNPLLNKQSDEYKSFLNSDFGLAYEGMTYKL